MYLNKNLLAKQLFRVGQFSIKAKNSTLSSPKTAEISQADGKTLHDFIKPNTSLSEIDCKPVIAPYVDAETMLGQGRKGGLIVHYKKCVLFGIPT